MWVPIRITCNLHPQFGRYWAGITQGDDLTSSGDCSAETYESAIAAAVAEWRSERNSARDGNRAIVGKK